GWGVLGVGLFVFFALCGGLFGGGFFCFFFGGGGGVFGGVLGVWGFGKWGIKKIFASWGFYF
ncbi:hypothetical protein, partial [Stenotrophomonas maltophilia]|uniref:hypothetical protein n=1 Tax=Stenotrophomonas maltophilia TaxID=40324 RepID=UPI0034E2B7E3